MVTALLIGTEELQAMLTDFVQWADGSPATAGAELTIYNINARAAQLAVREISQLLTQDYPPASTPGQPPHFRTGRLWRAVGYGQARAGSQFGSSDPASKFEYEVFVDSEEAPYAEYLEFGTSMMAARPFFFRGALAASEHINDEWQKSFALVVKRISEARQAKGRG